MIVRGWFQAAADQHAQQLVEDGRPVNYKRAAEILGRSRASASEFLTWFRWHLEVKAAEAAVARDTPVVEDETPATEQTITEAKRKESWVADGLVYTDLGQPYGVVFMTRSDHQAFRRDYTRLYGKGALNRSQMAYKYSLPDAHAVGEYVRIHGLRQTSIPHTDEEIEELGVEAAVDETITSRRVAYLQGLQEQERAAEIRDALRWRNFEFNARTIVEELKGTAPKLTEFRIVKKAKEPFIAVLGLSDLHMGKLCLDAQGGRVYDREIARAVAMKCLNDLLDQIINHGRPEKIIFMIGQDGAHVDNHLLTTTGGTPQANQTDGSFREIVRDLVRMLNELISRCLEVAPTEIWEVDGNHDRTVTMFVGLLMEEVWSSNSRVTFHKANAPWLFREYGENLLMASHGEGLRKEASIFKVFMTQARHQGCTLKPHLSLFTGHFHFAKDTDLGGVMHHQMPSPTPPDDWHARNSFVGSRQEASAYLIRKSGGRFAVLFAEAVAPQVAA